MQVYDWKDAGVIKTDRSADGFNVRQDSSLARKTDVEQLRTSARKFLWGLRLVFLVNCGIRGSMFKPRPEGIAYQLAGRGKANGNPLRGKRRISY